MSYVANVILNMGCLDEGENQRKLAEVNLFFDHRGLGLVDGGIGGTKNLERTLAIGAIHALDVGGFVAHLKGLHWDDTFDVQLMLCNEDDDGFQLIEISRVKE